MNKEKNYLYISHFHCYTQENPPCGLKGHHCCLCDIVTSGKNVEKENIENLEDIASGGDRN